LPPPELDVVTVARIEAVRSVDPDLAAFLSFHEQQRVAARLNPVASVGKRLRRRGRAVPPIEAALTLVTGFVAVGGYLTVGGFRPFRPPLIDDIHLALTVAAGVFAVALCGIVASVLYGRRRGASPLATTAMDAAILVAPFALFTVVGGVARLRDINFWHPTDVVSLVFLTLLFALCVAVIVVDSRRFRRSRLAAALGRPDSTEPLDDLTAEAIGRVDRRVERRIRAKIASVSERRRADFLARELAALEDLRSRGRLDDDEARSASDAARRFWD
jgi:hypothetical protein